MPGLFGSSCEYDSLTMGIPIQFIGESASPGKTKQSDSLFHTKTEDFDLENLDVKIL